VAIATLFFCARTQRLQNHQRIWIFPLTFSNFALTFLKFANRKNPNALMME
jgi:hypothetical protein